VFISVVEAPRLQGARRARIELIRNRRATPPAGMDQPPKWI